MLLVIRSKKLGATYPGKGNLVRETVLLATCWEPGILRADYSRPDFGHKDHNRNYRPVKGSGGIVLKVQV